MSLNSALLPSGIEDLLPPYAALEDETVRKLVDNFALFGFEQIKLPLLEFEESLLNGEEGKKKALSVFRLMDPLSQRMMGIRSDMTMQLARVTASCLKEAPRPLRLSYAADVLRVKGSQLRPERQFRQVGCELIGYNDPKAHIEVSLIALKALADLGIKDITLDLSMPQLVKSLLEDESDQTVRESLYEAVNKRDVGTLQSQGEAGKRLAALVQLSGRADSAFAALEDLPLPDRAKEKVENVYAVYLGLKEGLTAYGIEKQIMITLDPVEYKGFEYQSSPSFTFFAKNVRGELGRGGAYVTRFTDEKGDDYTEFATGFTLYMDSVLRALPEASPEKWLCVPEDVSWKEVAVLQGKGWKVKRCYGETDVSGCCHVFDQGEIKEIK